MMKETDRRKAADALAECRTFTEAAAKIGVDRRTLFRWLRDDEKLNTLATEAVELADMEKHERDMEIEERAFNVLWSIVDDEKTTPGDRIRALKTALDLRDRGIGSRRLRQWGGKWRSLFDELDDL